jgi:molybdenum cofactor cytidylyltransferase
MNTGTLPRLQIVILAAGFSSRLGQPKALVRVRGISLLRRTLTLVAQFAPAKIIVVLPRRSARHRFEARGLNVVFVANRRRADGLSSSVRLGVARARYSPALLLLPVDLAMLQSRDLARLISRWRSVRRCVLARRIEPQGRAPSAETPRGGVPLILPRWLYAQALDVTGDLGLREWVAALPSPQRVLLHLPSAALDVDTPQDLRAARRRLRRSGVSL